MRDEFTLLIRTTLTEPAGMMNAVLSATLRHGIGKTR